MSKLELRHYTSFRQSERFAAPPSAPGLAVPDPQAASGLPDPKAHLAEWLANSRAVAHTVRCAADDVAAWSAAECWMFELALSQ
jgi:hypothetical protein